MGHECACGRPGLYIIGSTRVPKRVSPALRDIIKPMFRGERESGLVDLDARVDLLREPEAGQEPARPRQEEEPDAYEAHVPEVEHVREPLVGAQSPKIIYGVRKHVEGRRAAREERPPPPAVVLATQLEVAQHDRDLAARRHQDDEH